jgi:hypothetical protein
MKLKNLSAEALLNGKESRREKHTLKLEIVAPHWEVLQQIQQIHDSNKILHPSCCRMQKLTRIDFKVINGHIDMRSPFFICLNNITMVIEQKKTFE